MLLMKTSFSKILRGSEGLALITVIFVAAFFLIFVTGGLFFAQLNLKIASNFKLATQAVEVADAGLQHGLAVIPWVWNFNSQLNCGTPPCTVVAQTSFPSVSGFTYTVAAKNDPADASATVDSNSRILVTAQANGPNSTKKIVEAYVRRSVATFTPPAALYVNAVSSYPTLDSSNAGMGAYYFDNNDGVKVIGNDTNPNNLLNQNDDTAGSQTSLYAIATTTNTVTTALKNEYNTNGYLHDVLGIGSEPDIGTVSDVLDVNEIANNFIAQPSKVDFDHLQTDSTICPATLPTPRPNPDPCILGTSSSPQITYIHDGSKAEHYNYLDGNVTGYGVLILRGRTTIRGSFRFYGLIVHQRTDSLDYLSFEDNAWVYGAVLLGSYDEGDGNGKKARFGLKDFVRIYYSSQALTMVDSNWGTLLPKPPRVFAWLDK